MSLQSLVEDEYARSFVEAQRQAHEELNTARAVAHSCLVDDAFRRAAESRKLESLHREAAAQDAREEAEFAERELQVAEVEMEKMTEHAIRTTESFRHAQRRRR